MKERVFGDIIELRFLRRRDQLWTLQKDPKPAKTRKDHHNCPQQREAERDPKPPIQRGGWCEDRNRV